jgi:hypothetical protein
MRGGALRIGAAIVAACLLALLAPPIADAGTIWVTDGNMNAGQTGGCNAFSVYGDLSVFYAGTGCPLEIGAFGTVPAGVNAFWMTTAPPGITINQAWTANPDVSASGASDGFVVGDFWENGSGIYGGSTLAPGQEWFNSALEGTPNINSQIYGIQIVCTHSATQGPCYGTPYLAVGGVELEGTENTGPSVTGVGSLWSEPSGAWVWNPSGDVWAVTMQAGDTSGICSMSADVGNVEVQGPIEARDNTVWQQCPTPASWDFGVDTRSYVPTTGSLPVQLIAVNAAGVGLSISRVLPVDNDPVGVSFRTPNDANPSIWVNHAVTVDATPSAGPSGVGGMNCSADQANAKAYSASGMTVDGDGVHTVSCTAWNNAVDPQGQPNSGTSSMTIHIDEAPPSLSFQSQNPGNPTALAVSASDSESGIAGGSIQMAPAGTSNWTSLPTTFDGSHLLSDFNDASRIGPYTFWARSCDDVGNCASTTEQLTLPVRLASDSNVSFDKIVNPLRRQVVLKRVRVGWHWVTVRRNHKLYLVRRGGHFKTIKVVRYVERCTSKRIRTGPRRGRVERVCQAPKVRVLRTLQVPFGHSVIIHGLYTTAAGVPLAGQPVQVLAAPNNGSAAFSEVAAAASGPDGSWSATIPPGPSRVIRAVTDGDATILPSSGQVTTIVPARVRLLKVWPRHVAWGGTVHLVGQLLGGYLPPGGALVRLRIGYGSTYNTYGIEEHVSGDGRFSTVASFGPGDPNMLRTYWFQIASLPMGNYPYAPAASSRVTVIVGGHPRRS